jgi:hypothetical protein
MENFGRFVRVTYHVYERRDRHRRNEAPDVAVDPLEQLIVDDLKITVEAWPL